jgi:hypothetical protein
MTSLSSSSRPYTSPSESTNNQRAKSPLASKLQQLEKKQYELTKQQLAFAHRKNMAKSDPTLSYKSANYKESDSTNSIDDSNTVSSSVKSENIRDIFKLLDDEEIMLDDPVQVKKSGAESFRDPFESAIKITGLKPAKDNISLSSKSPRPKQQPISARTVVSKPKIRNYNIKN